MSAPRVLEVLRVFGRLGLTSFGGPIAHLAYFRRELVERRQWLSDAAYAHLVAYCQFVPGPASSFLRRTKFSGESGQRERLSIWPVRIPTDLQAGTLR